MKDFSVTVSGRAVWPQARLERRASADIADETLAEYGAGGVNVGGEYSTTKGLS